MKPPIKVPVLTEAKAKELREEGVKARAELHKRIRKMHQLPAWHWLVRVR